MIIHPYNRAIFATSREGQPPDLEAAFVWLAILHSFTKDDDSAEIIKGKRWITVDHACMKLIVALEKKQYDDALERIRQLGLIKIAYEPDTERGQFAVSPIACLTRKGMKESVPRRWDDAKWNYVMSMEG